MNYLNKATSVNGLDKHQLPQLLTRRQVADMLCVHTETIKRYQRSNIIKAICINSRVVRYKTEDVLRFLESRATS